MKKAIILAIGIAVLLFMGFILYMLFVERQDRIVSPVLKDVKERVFPLNKYSFENLSKSEFRGNKIEIGEKIAEDDEDFESYIFYFYAEDPENHSDVKRVSGVMKVPQEEGVYPVVVQFRGYVDRAIYESGIGTSRTAQEYAKAGFISLAPDFLGYGESDNPSNDSIEERFQTYTTALSLLASLQNLNSAFERAEIPLRADVSKLGIWGHSNGGHIALSVLAITKKEIPTVLWAPVSKPFPYSILYFTDEFEDEGKALRYVVADFEKNYDVFDFSPPRYYKWITAPLQIHQGTADDAVPVEWSNELVERLKEQEADIEYYVYPGADHNLMGGWNLAVERSIAFYNERLKD